MGLFAKKPKKMCPMCGNPASWFLPTKVEDQPLCDDCSSKVFELSTELQGKVLENMTTLREYFDVFDVNKALRDNFQETFRLEFGLFGGCIRLDVPHRILRLSDSDNAFAYEGENIVSFRITEDETTLFEGTRDALVCYESDIPRRVKDMGDEIDRYLIERRQCEHLEFMEEELARQAEARGEIYTKRYIPSPDYASLNPLKKFHVYIETDHPYRKEQKEYKQNAPTFAYNNPTITGYLDEYEAIAGDLRRLAEGLIAIINPNAPKREIASETASGSRAAPSAAAAPADPVVEIQRYKALLDSGAITEEEFTAKKRQLLGI